LRGETHENLALQCFKLELKRFEPGMRFDAIAFGAGDARLQGLHFFQEIHGAKPGKRRCACLYGPEQCAPRVALQNRALTPIA
jgi:hypothetical protein